MAQTNGVLSIKDLLSYRNASAADIGFDNIAATLASETAWTNQIVDEMLADLTVKTTNQIEIWGSAVAHTMDKTLSS